MNSQYMGLARGFLLLLVLSASTLHARNGIIRGGGSSGNSGSGRSLAGSGGATQIQKTEQPFICRGIGPNGEGSSIPCDANGKPITPEVRERIQGCMNSNSSDGQMSSEQLYSACSNRENGWGSSETGTSSAGKSNGNMNEYANVQACLNENPGETEYCNNFDGGRSTGKPDEYASDQECLQKNPGEFEFCNNFGNGDSPTTGNATDSCPGGRSPTGRCLDAAGPDALAMCEQAAQMAANDCNSEAQSWMKNINMVSKGVGPIMKQMNPGGCGSLEAVDVGTSSSLATFKIMCSNATQECETACKKTPADSSQVTQMSAHLSACRKHGVNGKQAEAAAAQGTQEIMQAVVACKQAFGTGDPFANPNSTAYQGKTADEILANLQAQQSGGGLDYRGVQGDSGGLGGSGGGRSTGFDIGDLEDPAKKKAAMADAGGAGGSIGGQKGGSGAGSGSGANLGAGGRASPKGGVRGMLSNILSGFFGGGGGGGLFGGSGSKSGGGISSWFGGEKPQAAVNAPDLRQFLPGGAKDPRKHRGIAGRAVGADGMSGPHANIWQMINNRYQYKKASLLP